MDIPEPIRRTIVILLRELIDGPPGEAAYMVATSIERAPIGELAVYPWAMFSVAIGDIVATSSEARR